MTDDRQPTTNKEVYFLMNNLTTRKIVLGMLMALVLTFSVQVTADAITQFTRTAGDLQTYAENQPFTVTFTVGLEPTVIKPNHLSIPAGDPDIPGTLNLTNTPYYVDGQGGGSVDNTYNGEAGISYADAHNYDEEAINITVSGATLTQVQNINVTDAPHPHIMSEGGTGASLISTSVILRLVVATEGEVDIRIMDTTSNDYPSGVIPATTLEFIVYIIDNPVVVSADTLDLLGANTTNYFRGLDDFTDPDVGATVTGGANFNNVKIKYDVVSGNGQVYVTKSGRVGPKGRSITTSSEATVQLDMNGTTNKVTVSVPGSNTYIKPVTAFFIYGLPSLEATSGSSGQKGATSGRLENPLGIRVKDERGSIISGIEVTFTTAVTGAKFIPLPSIPETMYTFNPASPQTIIIVETNSSGIAETYYQLGSNAGMEDITVVAAGVTRTDLLRSTAEAATGIPAIEIVSGNNQRADSGGNVKDLLVVRVTRNNRRISDVQVTFVANRGILTNTIPPGTADSDVKITDTTDSSGEAQVSYFVDHSGPAEVVAYITGIEPITYKREVTFGINGAPSTGRPSTPETSTNTITISPSSTTGEPGEEVTIRVASSPSGVFATLGSNDFGATRFSPQSDFTPFTSTLLLPVEEGTHSFFATGGVLTAGRASVTVEAELGELSITAIGPVAAGVQTFSITARDSDGDSAIGAFTARLSGTGFTSRNVEISGGRGNARVTLPTAARLYTLTVSATGYEDGETPVRIAGTGQQQVADEDEEEVEEEVTVAAEPDSIEITGPSTRSGTVNEELDTPLLVRVLDDDGDGLEGARVFYRVSSGRGRLSARGNGRAIGVVTDDDGYARASFTPLDGGTITVRANTDDLSATVTFTITTGSASSASGARDSGTGGTPGMISPVVHVGAASRPPMLWVDGGAIYALVGASPQRFAPGVDNALNITVGGGKVYWTEKTGESGGTINSANLNGSDVTELTSIKAVPMGIAVDVAGSQLYWTNSRGRIQSADLDGSGITNVMQNLQSPMDLALAGGNAYWTQGNGSVRFVNLRGQKVVRNVSTGTDTPGSLVIGGGKVYWTETTGESGGTINSANLNGTGATQLASILAAPMGIAVDGSRSKLYWTNSRGRVQSANLDGSGITNVVSGLGSPGDMVLSNSIAAPAATTTTRTTTTASNKYDVNGDGSVNNADSDAITVAIAAGATDAKYDVNGDGTVNVFDLVEIIANRDPGAAGAPTLFGMKMSAAQIDSLQEQIDLLIAMNDRSPAALRTLIYLQQLLVTARPEKTLLLANYPNPFNPETWIPYELATDTDVRITIYNTQGVVIRSLQLGHQSAGYYTGRDRAAYWDGRNALGEQVASGLYFYQLETDEMSLMRKMVILK